MAIPSRKTPLNALQNIVSLVRARGDAFFLLATCFAIGYAALLFYQYVYGAFSMQEPPPRREPVFNAEAYQQVIQRIENDPQELQKLLNELPRNPFR